jgi:uncharacterized Zn-finger protein
MWFDLGEGNEFTCPYCGHGHAVSNWTTEYGEPLDGDHCVKCLKCNTEFRLEVFTSTEYTGTKYS